MKRTLKWTLGLVIGFVVLLMAATAAYAAGYAHRALPGASVDGVNMTGRTYQEAEHALSERAQAVRLYVTVDDQVSQFSLPSLGVTVDVDETTSHLFAANRSFDEQISALFKKRDIPIVVKVDQTKANEAAQKIAATAAGAAKDARVVLNQDATKFVIEPAQAGRTIDVSTLTNTAIQAAHSLSSQSLSLHSEHVQPAFSTEQAQHVADAANTVLALPVSITGRLGQYSPSAADKAQWVTPASLDGRHTLSVDQSKVDAWVKTVADKETVAPVAGLRTVDVDGAVLSTQKQGEPGYKVTNAADIAAALAGALQASQPYSGQLNVNTEQPKYATKLVAADSAQLVYQAAPGEKWIDLDLSRNLVTAYEGATRVNDPIAIVPGRPGLDTPTGTYKIYLKYATQTMRGTNPDGTPYIAPGIPWVSYFTGSIAFHGAPWRTSFGWSGAGGSHGCVNMPESGAKFIYDWAPIGTVVVSHS